MKRLLSVVVVAFFALAPLAHADSILNINITYVTAFMSPNNGSGDNISFTLIGPGTSITGIGGMACFSWCNGPIPDLNSVATSQVFVSNFLSATVGGIAYDPNNPDNVYVGRNAAFFGYPPTPVASGVGASTDGGQTWDDLGNQQLGTISDLAFGIDGRYLFVASDRGVSRLSLT